MGSFFFALERIFPQGKPKPPPRQNKVVRAARRIKLDRVQIVGSLARPMKTGARSVEAGLI